MDGIKIFRIWLLVHLIRKASSYLLHRGNGDKYNLNVIKDTLNKRSAKDYSDLDIKELFDIIPISFNGMVYINNELDQNQEYLNILRTRYNPEFDLNKVKESNIIVI